MLFSRSIQAFDGRSLPDQGSDVRGYVMNAFLKNYEKQFFVDNPKYNKSGLGIKDPAQKKVFYQKYHPILTELINRSTVYMATYPEDPDTFMGFLVGDNHRPTIHYVYVRSDNRRDGIARELVNQYQLEFKGCDLPDSGALWTFTHLPFNKHVILYLDNFCKENPWYKRKATTDYENNNSWKTISSKKKLSL